MDSQRWRARAREVQFRVNACWYGHYLLRFLAVSNCLHAIGAGVLRHYRLDFDLFWWVYLGSSLLCALLALLPARKRYIGERAALLRLDQHLGLRNQLVAADDGVAEWPPASPARQWPYRLKGWTMSSPFLLSALVLGFSFLMPMQSVQAEIPVPVAQPQAWEELEQSLEELKETELFEERAIETLEKKLDELQAQAPEEWFNNSSLEATDSLKAELDQKLSTNLRQSELAGRNLDALRESLQQGQRQNASEAGQALEDALKKMSEQGLPMNAELAKQLAEAAGMRENSLRQLSQQQLEQMKELSEQLSQCSSICQKLGNGEGDPLDNPPSGLGQKFDGDGPIKRGPGVAPMALGDESHVESEREGALDPLNIGRAALGDLVGESRRSEASDPAQYEGSELGEQFKDYGSGGDAIWKQNITPAEREALMKFYQ